VADKKKYQRRGMYTNKNGEEHLDWLFVEHTR